MLIEKIINMVYENMLETILLDVQNKDKEEVSNNYLKYLHEIYSKKKVNENEFDNFFNIILEVEKEIWKNREYELKMQYLKDDKSYKLINAISGKAYNLAKEKLEKDCEYTISKEEANIDIAKMMQELENVEEFNKDAAKHAVSEAIVDFEYASGNNKIISFRISHLINRLKR